ncbi:hypothetical protein QJS66_08915 [Kocuria rhizophila]|nr:hypothetical protein QJS66_08915 [Kocuria rhizophila]
MSQPAPAPPGAPRSRVRSRRPWLSSACPRGPLPPLSRRRRDRRVVVWAASGWWFYVPPPWS